MPKYVSIDITNGDAKVVQLDWTRKTGTRLEHAFAVPLSDLPNDEAGIAQRAARVKAALKARRITGTCATVFPKQSATIRSVLLPSGDPVEITSMVPFEAEKLISFNVERHIISHQLVSLDRVQGSEIMIAAVDEPILARYLAVAVQAGLDPSLVAVSSLSLLDSLRHAEHDAATRGCVALINIAWGSIDISILKDGRLVTSRSLMPGLERLLKEVGEAAGVGRDLTIEDLSTFSVVNPEDSPLLGSGPAVTHEGDPAAGFEVVHDGAAEERRTRLGDSVRAWLQKLVSHLRQTYEFALREYSIPSIEQILISGEGACMQGLDHALVMHVGVPTSVFNPLAKLAPAPGANLPPATAFPMYAVALGSAQRLAAGEGDRGINLLPSIMREKQENAERRFQFMITGAMAIVLMAMLFLMYSGDREFQRQAGDIVSVYRDEMEPVLDEARENERRIQIIRSIRSEGTGLLTLMEKLANYRPLGPVPGGRLTLMRMQFYKDEELSLEGHALEIEDMNNFAQFLRTLENDGRLVFASVYPKPTVKQLAGRQQAIYEFSIKAVFRKGEDEK